MVHVILGQEQWRVDRWESENAGKAAESAAPKAMIPLRKLTEGVRVEMRIQGKRGDTCLGYVLYFKGNQRKSVTSFSFAEIGDKAASQSLRMLDTATQRVQTHYGERSYRDLSAIRRADRRQQGVPPSSVSNRYFLSIRTHGRSCRRRVISSLRLVSTFSSFKQPEPGCKPFLSTYDLVLHCSVSFLN
jgi:hypothetical protein